MTVKDPTIDVDPDVEDEITMTSSTCAWISSFFAHSEFDDDPE